MALSKEKLDSIIASTGFDQLIGEVESIYFDCKREPYHVENEPGKRELAKDVSSFANAEGGYILIGIKTKPSATRFGDEVEAIHPLTQDLVDTVQYKNIIGAWIYPEIEELDVGWVPITSDPTRGVIVITVPKQRIALRPFLIKITLDGAKHVEVVFGYAERKGDNSQPLTVVDLQRILQVGFNYEEVLSGRFDQIEALIKGVEPVRDVLTEGIAPVRVEQKIEKALTYVIDKQ